MQTLEHACVSCCAKYLHGSCILEPWRGLDKIVVHCCVVNVQTVYIKSLTRIYTLKRRPDQGSRKDALYKKQASI